MSDQAQPPLPDMPEMPDTPEQTDASDASDMTELLTEIVMGESEKDIAAIVAGSLLRIAEQVEQLAYEVAAVKTYVHNYTTVDISRKEELSQRINTLSERHDQFFARMNERIDGLRDAVQFVGEQQQWVTDETAAAKTELKELATNLMTNPGQVVKAFMGGGLLGGRKNKRAAIVADSSEEMSENGTA